jgi:hypothetical protein
MPFFGVFANCIFGTIIQFWVQTFVDGLNTFSARQPVELFRNVDKTGPTTAREGFVRVHANLNMSFPI